jgi:hypothetical protein
MIRTIPPKGDHSIAWCIYHLARIEDTALSVLMAGVPMLLDEDSWEDRLNIPYRDAGNVMSKMEIQRLSREIAVEALKEYRAAVGVRTREFIRALTPDQLKIRVNPEQIHQVVELGSLRPEAYEVLEYWSKRTMGGLLLMPATRHNIVHINEALRLKDKLMRRLK